MAASRAVEPFLHKVSINTGLFIIVWQEGIKQKMPTHYRVSTCTFIAGPCSVRLIPHQL